MFSLDKGRKFVRKLQLLSNFFLKAIIFWFLQSAVVKSEFVCINLMQFLLWLRFQFADCLMLERWNLYLGSLYLWAGLNLIVLNFRIGIFVAYFSTRIWSWLSLFWQSKPSFGHYWMLRFLQWFLWYKSSVCIRCLDVFKVINFFEIRG